MDNCRRIGGIIDKGQGTIDEPEGQETIDKGRGTIDGDKRQ